MNNKNKTHKINIYNCVLFLYLMTGISMPHRTVSADWMLVTIKQNIDQFITFGSLEQMKNTIELMKSHSSSMNST